MKTFITLFALLIAALAGIRPAAAAELTVFTGRQLNELLAEVKVESGVTVILIPGILGSKLTVRNSGKETLIWGGSNTNDAALQYNPSQHVEPKILDEVEIATFVKNFKYNVYGNAIVDVRDASPDGRTRLKVFPYDWRQSNVKSADRLQEWICTHAGELKGRKVIFVAHSMGGLVLKRWLLAHYDQNRACGEAQLHQIFDIAQLIFVGTPHAGAPIFISALVDHYELLKDHPIINSFLSWGLNTYGSSFESIYELLPIVQSQRCRREKNIDTPEYIYLRTSGQPPKPVELFVAQQWRDLGIPKKRHIADDDKFYNEFLPPQLARAEKLLCELWKYDFGALRGRVMSIYGKDTTRNTASKYVLTRWRNVSRNTSLWEKLNIKANEIVIDETSFDFGDGTVPTVIASTAPESKFAHWAQSKHQALLDDDVFREKLAGQINESNLALIRKAYNEDPEKKAAFERYALAKNALIPVRSMLAMNKPFQQSTPELAWAVRVNAQLLNQRGIDLKTLGAQAVQSPDKNFKVEAYAQIIADDTVPIAKRLWSANNLGHQLFVDGNYGQAAQILALATAEIQAKPAVQFDKNLAGMLFNNAGWTALKTGELNMAEASFSNAKKLGYFKAQMGLEEVNSMRDAIATAR